MIMQLTGNEVWCAQCNALMLPSCVNGCTGRPLPGDGPAAPARIRQHRLLAAARLNAWEAINLAFGGHWSDRKHRAATAMSELERRAFEAGRATERWSAERRASLPNPQQMRKP